MSRERYEVHWALTASKQLKAVSDRRVREKLVETAERLAREPEKQGKPLLGEMSGLRSLRAVGQHWRILYRIEDKTVVVLVVAVGRRKEGNTRDVYALARKLLKLGLIE